MAPDYFIDDALEYFMVGDSKLFNKKKSGGASAAPSGNEVQDIFNKITGIINEEMVGKVNSVYAFELSGEHAGQWTVDLKNGAGKDSLLVLRTLNLITLHTVV